MWVTRFAVPILLVAATTTAGVLAPAPSPARAGGVGDPIIGDINGDGLPDEVFIGVTAPHFCSVVVQYGVSGGSFQPPIAFIYLRPNGGDPDLWTCPDLGAVIQADDDPYDELYVAWSHPPEGLHYNRLVLNDNFEPQIYYLAPWVTEPWWLGSADFDGDGSHDVFSVGGGGFASGWVTPRGLIRGPESWCAGYVSSYQLRNVDRNPVVDALLSYTDDCGSHTNGVVIVRQDGSFQVLHRGPHTWTARFVSVNGDRNLDVRTQNQTTGAVNYWIGRGDGRFVLAPVAIQDKADVPGDRRTAIPVLANDFATDLAKISIVTPPRYGTVQITSDRRIIYQPRSRHGRTDRFVYRLEEQGRHSNAAVNLRIVD